MGFLASLGYQKKKSPRIHKKKEKIRWNLKPQPLAFQTLFILLAIQANCCKKLNKHHIRESRNLLKIK